MPRPSLAEQRRQGSRKVAWYLLGFAGASVLAWALAWAQGWVLARATERLSADLRNTTYARQLADSIGLFKAVSELDDDTPAGIAARAAAGPYLDGHVKREFNIPGITFGGRYDGSPLIVPDGSVPPPDTPNSYVPTACPGGRRSSRSCSPTRTRRARS